MRATGVLAAAVTTVLAAGLVACHGGSPSSSPGGTPQSTGSIVVFAAASLKSAFTEIGGRFKTDNPGSGVEFEFAGSSALATQLTQGATADVFASADTAQMATVANAGLLAGNPANFASNTLVIVTAPGNPRHVGAFADLAKPGLSVVVCQQPVPCGAATHRIEDSTGVHLNPVSEEPSVTDVLNKVTSGQADAALVYRTDAMSAAGKVSTVSFPQASTAVNVYPIAVLKKAPRPEPAQKFVDLVTSDAGRQILVRFGFAQP
ncbi:molybdate ABC transporter substrate-binding protein [Mycobacterium parmense]|uniref:Molybdate-binding protein n=1 Tax=Mycobacterium parmense TaxID=185642 RepID=A0A7I7YQR2_9MYCO|nr:molybdate ABC transporter substrate-binding protein [Mycobacterium parmense]MCV7353343.1 molybdate ABC transporter substrate-binding protein [Mycobacterium parmense]ORW62044.1 molybdate-binding protein [Mycobacterium parmense]BBZ44100.1 molybdate-binding protein [Mycobacterium parmense]